MKKLSALLLALVMVFALAACGNGTPAETTAPTEPTTEPTTVATTEPTTEPTTEATTEPTTEPTVDLKSLDYPMDPEQAEPFFGTWETIISMDGTELGLEDFETPLDVVLTFTFDEDGILTTGLNSEKTQESLDTFKNDFSEYMTQALYAQFEEQGLDADAAEESMKAAYGMSIAEYVTAIMDTFTVDAMFGDLDEARRYKVEGDQLFTYDLEAGETALTFEMDGDTLTLDSTEEPTEDSMYTFPITLTRAE